MHAKQQNDHFLKSPFFPEKWLEAGIFTFYRCKYILHPGLTTRNTENDLNKIRFFLGVVKYLCNSIDYIYLSVFMLFIAF